MAGVDPSSLRAAITAAAAASPTVPAGRSVCVFAVIDGMECNHITLYVIAQAVHTGPYPPLPVSGLNGGQFFKIVLSRRVLWVGCESSNETLEYCGNTPILLSEWLDAAIERGGRKDAEGGSHI